MSRIHPQARGLSQITVLRKWTLSLQKIQPTTSNMFMFTTPPPKWSMLGTPLVMQVPIYTEERWFMERAMSTQVGAAQSTTQLLSHGVLPLGTTPIMVSGVLGADLHRASSSDLESGS